MLFTGTYELTIDAKNAVDSGGRAVADGRREGRHAFLPGSGIGAGRSACTVTVITRPTRSAITPRCPRPRERGLRRPVLLMASLLDVDKQVGWVVLPQRLLEFAGISGR